MVYWILHYSKTREFRVVQNPINHWGKPSGVFQQAVSLDVMGAGSEMALVQTAGHGGQSNREWRLTPVGDGYFKISAKHSGKSLDVRDAGGDMALVQTAGDGGQPNRAWKIVPVAGAEEFFTIRARHSGKVLDVRDAGGELAVLQTAGDNDAGQPNRQFAIVPVGDPKKLAAVSIIPNMLLHVPKGTKNGQKFAIKVGLLGGGEGQIKSVGHKLLECEGQIDFFGHKGSFLVRIKDDPDDPGKKVQYEYEVADKPKVAKTGKFTEEGDALTIEKEGNGSAIKIRPFQNGAGIEIELVGTNIKIGLEYK